MWSLYLRAFARVVAQSFAIMVSLCLQGTTIFFTNEASSSVTLAKKTSVSATSVFRARNSSSKPGQKVLPICPLAHSQPVLTVLPDCSLAAPIC